MPHVISKLGSYGAGKLKVTAERLPESQVELSVEVEAEAVARAMDRAYRRLVNRINVPGFRRGKAPRQIVERMVGRETLWQEGVEELVPNVYKEAVQQAQIQPIDEPQIDIVQQEPLVLKFVVPVRPTVELANYRNIRIPKVEVGVTDADVAAALEQLREQYAEWVVVHRPAEPGDMVRVDVEGWVGAAPLLYSVTGETLVRSAESETIVDRKDVKFWVSPENRFPAPGFAEHLVGVVAGQVKEFTLTLPADFRQPEYANRSAAFRVTVHDVEERRLPALDDEFAKKVGDFESFDALRDDVRKKLQERLELEAARQLEDVVVRTVVDESKVELPPSLVAQEVDRLMERLTDRLKVENMSLDQYLKAINKSEGQLRDELRDDAVRNLKTTLVLDAVADSEGIKVSEGEVQGQIDRVSESLGDEAGQETVRLLSSPEGRLNIAFDLRTRKVIERLVALATRPDEAGVEDGGSEQTSEAMADEQPSDDAGEPDGESGDDEASARA